MGVYVKRLHSPQFFRVRQLRHLDAIHYRRFSIFIIKTVANTRRAASSSGALGDAPTTHAAHFDHSPNHCTLQSRVDYLQGMQRAEQAHNLEEATGAALRRASRLLWIRPSRLPRQARANLSNKEASLTKTNYRLSGISSATSQKTRCGVGDYRSFAQ